MKLFKITIIGIYLFTLSACNTNDKNMISEKERKDNQEIVKIYIEEVWNKGNLDRLDEIIDDSYVNNNPGTPNPKLGAEGLKPIIKTMREAFPDLKFEINDLVIGKNRIVIFSTMSGTHKGDLFGIPATGNKVSIKQMQIEKIKDGKIVEHWRVTDELNMMKQLGVIE